MTRPTAPRCARQTGARRGGGRADDDFMAELLAEEAAKAALEAEAAAESKRQGEGRGRPRKPDAPKKKKKKKKKKKVMDWAH